MAETITIGCQTPSILKLHKEDSLVPQEVPVEPTAQAHVRLSIPSVHVPPFWQGFSEQLLISETITIGCQTPSMLKLLKEDSPIPQSVPV